MQTEIEAKFLNIDHDVIRQKLNDLSAQLVSSNCLMKRVIMDYPDKHMQKDDNSWLRIRDEGEKITLTLKQTTEHEFGGATEIEVIISDFDKTTELFKAIGLEVQAFQESKREIWSLDGVEIMLDEWPWLEPFIEVEGPSKAAVQGVATKLGMDWQAAIFGSVTTIYRKQYPAITKDHHISELPSITFSEEKPRWFGSVA